MVEPPSHFVGNFMDALGTAQALATLVRVSFPVSDLKASPPLEECEPSISIEAQFHESITQLLSDA